MKTLKTDKWKFEIFSYTLEVEGSPYGVSIATKSWFSGPAQIRIPKAFLFELIKTLQKVDQDGTS